MQCFSLTLLPETCQWQRIYYRDTKKFLCFVADQSKLFPLVLGIMKDSSKIHLSIPKHGQTMVGLGRHGAEQTAGQGDTGHNKVPTFRSPWKPTAPLALQRTVTNCSECLFASSNEGNPNYTVKETKWPVDPQFICGLSPGQRALFVAGCWPVYRRLFVFAKLLSCKACPGTFQIHTNLKEFQENRQYSSMCIAWRAWTQPYSRQCIS